MSLDSEHKALGQIWLPQRIYSIYTYIQKRLFMAIRNNTFAEWQKKDLIQLETNISPDANKWKIKNKITNAFRTVKRKHVSPKGARKHCPFHSGKHFAQYNMYMLVGLHFIPFDRIYLPVKMSSTFLMVILPQVLSCPVNRFIGSTV